MNRYVLAGAVAIGILGVSGCGSEPEPAAKAPAAPIAVSVADITPGEWPGRYEATGTVAAKTTVVVSSRLPGYAREVRAQVGDRVREGQVVVVIDARELESGVRQAEAAREEVKSSIPEAESAVAAARAQLELAQATYNRMQDLLNKKSITNQEFDETTARWKAAQAGLDMARARRTQLDAKLAQTEQEVHAAGIQRGFAEITAPFAGTVITRSVEPGSLAMPGAPLFTIEREGTYRLEASVEESRLGTVRVGTPVVVTIDGIRQSFQGKVAEIVPAVDAAARTGTMKVDLPAMAGLRSGLFGRAAYSGDTRKVIAAPAASVIQRGQLQQVFVADGNVARARLVTLGDRQQDQVEVLSGLNPGDRVISPAVSSLTDGAPIEVRR
jgi:RND family efflux transporter MFP subunit